MKTIKQFWFYHVVQLCFVKKNRCYSKEKAQTIGWSAKHYYMVDKLTAQIHAFTGKNDNLQHELPSETLAS